MQHPVGGLEKMKKPPQVLLRRLVTQRGLEPRALCLKGRCSTD